MPYHLTIRPIYFVSLLGRGSVIFDEPHFVGRISRRSIAAAAVLLTASLLVVLKTRGRKGELCQLRGA